MKSGFHRLIMMLMTVLSCQWVFASVDTTYMPNIQGIRLFMRGNQFSYPVIQLGALSSLELHFDDLDNKVKNYSYSWQLCDAEWNPVDLSLLDYIQGFTQNRLTQYRFSSISRVKYIHYQVILPEQNCMPTKSGNYLLKVFLNGDPGKPAFTRRLLIIDNKIPIGIKILQPYNGNITFTHHKVQFSFDKGKLNILNPQQQLKVVALQNFRWDNAITGMQPLFMRGNMYEYNGERDFLFPAGKEFRWADLRSFRYQSNRIERIDKDTIPAQVTLFPDPQRSNLSFLFYEDFNGFYQVSCTDASNPWWQSDYGFVHFTYVPAGNKPYMGKEVYICGQMTDYALNEDTRLQFNEEKGVYETTLFMKQGYYNYQYVTLDTRDKRRKPETALTEGDFWETENWYTVLVYYRSLGNRYDELLGAVTINSKTGTLIF